MYKAYIAYMTINRCPAQKRPNTVVNIYVKCYNKHLHISWCQYLRFTRTGSTARCTTVAEAPTRVLCKLACVAPEYEVNISRHENLAVRCPLVQDQHTCVILLSDIPFVVVTSFGLLARLAGQQNVVFYFLR